MDWLLDPQIIAMYLGDAFANQFVQFTVAFALAAWIHGNKVRKEIKTQMNYLTDTIQDLARALRQDLANHSDRIGKVEESMSELQVEVQEIKHNRGDSWPV